MQQKLARIAGSGAYLPEKRLTNQDLERLVDTTDEWIVSRTGMKERRIAEDGEFASHMGAKAARVALEKAGIKPEELNLIIVTTSTPDYIFPSTAALIQAELGAHRAAAFDFLGACAGYIYGLALAKGLVESGQFKKVLLIATEKLSTIVDYTDRNTCVLFGDGAGASVITDEGPGLAIEHVAIGTDGTQSDLLSVPAGGCRQPVSQETLDQRAHFIRMSGTELFKQAVRHMTQAILDSLAELGLSESDVTWLVPHQANIRIVDAIRKRFNIAPERTYITVDRYGNTSASSVPIALCDLMKEHQIKQGDRLMLPAFGAGLAWGTALLRKL